MDDTITMDDKITQQIIDRLFKDNPNIFIEHHLNSYNEFFSDGIKRIFREKNPVKIIKNQDDKTNNFNLRCELFFGGKNGDKLYYGKPIIFDDNNEHFMYPNEARLRNMTYAITIHYDVDVNFYIREKETDPFPNEPTHTRTLEKIFLGRFPIMINSNLCILNGLSPKVRFELGECKNDYGGYFIIDGKEKCIVSQEKFADNMLYVRDKVNELYSHSAEIRSVSEDASKPIRNLSVRMVAPSPTMENGQIVVNVPNVRKPVPLFILMRALGVESDKSIIEHCLLNLDKYKQYVDLFYPSIYDAGMIFNQVNAIKYIATLTKRKSIPGTLEILTNYLLPHVGEMNFKDKAYFIGHMVREMLKVYKKDKKPTDRDSFKFKRVELPGSLIYDLFNEYYSIQQKQIFQKFDKAYYYNKGLYQGIDFINLIDNNYKNFFSERIVEIGFRKAFKGDWGAEAHTKRIGVLQDLNRLSYNSAISQLRKINLPLDASAKVVGPRLLHSSQWGIIDPVDTPDGGNVGLHKHLAIATRITTNCSSYPMIKLLRKMGMRLLSESDPLYISTVTKVIVNGNWVGTINNPKGLIEILKKYRRISLIPTLTSLNWDITNEMIEIYTDSGRLCRPIYYIDSDGNPSYNKPAIMEVLKSGNFTWNQLISGFAKKKKEYKELNKCDVFESVSSLYNTDNLDDIKQSLAIIDYMDTSEAETSLIAFQNDDLSKKPYSHIEIHPSLILGVMGNQVIFAENNQLPRDLYACGQMKQAVSLYHSNYQVRFDKMGVVLNNGGIPLIKSRYLEKINKEEHPYGENVIVAIMCYGSYNVEDSILFNEGSVKRGMFRTTYFNTYETREETTKAGDTVIDTHFANIEENNVVGLKPGYDYSHLDKNGLIKKNTYVDDKKVLIGRITTNIDEPEVSADSSIITKKGQLGYVDQTFITEGEEGTRIAKVRIRHERIPAIGDKFCSRCGQKGTIGLIIPEEDMPFTKDGIKPDLIVNPHALPSRMTIGQLVETLMGKACVNLGGFGDCTAFFNKGQKATVFGQMLRDNGFHSSGNEVLYNGQTGEQVEADIFIGPTYYMRLKHMVKDKINYRARGPRTVLTRQTVQGRARGGGLRIGEMERDGIIAHGASSFLKESMLVRGDDYYMAVCNKTGMIAIYNQTKNLFISPMADGPIKFTGNINENMNIENVTKYGRTFSIVRIPYALKLLIQELQTMNIQMRIITEDNINHLSNLSFSDNIIKLTGLGETPETVIEQANKSLLKEDETDEKSEEPELVLPELPEEAMETPIEKGPLSPGAEETKGEYAPTSPMPREGPVSPSLIGYAPSSPLPTEEPVSPSLIGYAPSSPLPMPMDSPMPMGGPPVPSLPEQKGGSYNNPYKSVPDININLNINELKNDNTTKKEENDDVEALNEDDKKVFNIETPPAPISILKIDNDEKENKDEIKETNTNVNDPNKKKIILK